MTSNNLTHDQTYPTHINVAQKLPLSLQFVIFTNYFFTINGWSVFFYMVIYLALFQAYIDFIYIILMLIPAFILSSISIIVSKKLLRKSNIILSSLHVLIDILFVDMLNSGPISSSIQAGINLNELHWIVMILLLLSLFLSTGSLVLLIFNKSLQLYYLYKDKYIKPWFIRNFGVSSILVSIPLILLYISFF